jgi:hypothetical protein
MASDTFGVDESERAAIHDFFIHATMPILVQEGDQFGIIATGTLFKIAGKSFLITAAHTLDEFHPSRWCYPTHPRRGRIHTLGFADYVRPNQSGLDVCVVQLNDPEVIATLEANWRFLTLENVWLPDASADAVLLAGYPSARAQYTDENLQGRIFIIRQKMRDDVPSEASASADPLIRGIDVFIDYQDAVNEYTGENISRVHIGGMSGCSVWAYRKRGWRSHTFWSPEASLRVIGIQSAYLENKYVRAKSWGVMLNLLAHFDSEIQIARDAFVTDLFTKITPHQ